MDTIYSHFLECRELTFDTFWKIKFTECAKGIFPEGVKYLPTKHAFLINDKEIYLPDEVKELFTFTKDIFEGLGIKTDKDKFYEILAKEGEEGTGFGPSKKMEKEKAIMNYTHKLLTKYRLPKKEKTPIYNTIILSLRHKAIKPDDVVYDDEGEIKEIKGLYYDDELKTVRSPPYKVPAEEKKTSKSHSKTIYKHLDQYVKSGK